MENVGLDEKSESSCSGQSGNAQNSDSMTPVLVFDPRASASADDTTIM